MILIHQLRIQNQFSCFLCTGCDLTSKWLGVSINYGSISASVSNNLCGSENSREQAIRHFRFNLDLLPILIQTRSEIVHRQDMSDNREHRGVTEVSPRAYSPSKSKECNIWITNVRVDLAIFEVTIRVESERIWEEFWVMEDRPVENHYIMSPRRSKCGLYHPFPMTIVPLGMKYPSYSSASLLVWPKPNKIIGLLTV